MLSIIICSRKSDISDELKQNIADTVGCDYELVVIDNSTNKYSIFSAYNEGVNRSKGELLCFCHDDIVFHTHAWGGVIEYILLNNNYLGGVGVLGGHLLPKQESYYLLSSGNILQQQKDGTVEKELRNDHFDENGLDEMAALDGLFMVIPKRLFVEKSLMFDESYGGFHMYDLDISMQIREAGYKLVVTDRILVEHRTDITGVLEGAAFRKELHKFYGKWESSFPVIVGVSDAYLSEKYTELYYKLESIHFSHAYKLGSMLMKPVKSLKRVIRKL